MDASNALGFTPAVGDLPFTPQQRSLLSLANELGRTRFAPRAAQWDREASFPFANYDDLRDAGLLALCVPKTSGGLGADYATYMMVAAEVGRGVRPAAIVAGETVSLAPATTMPLLAGTGSAAGGGSGTP